MDNLGIIRSTTDPHSSSRPEEARVIDTHLELNVDFIQKILTGIASLTITRRNPLINVITLDTLALEIVSVTNASDGTPSNYEVIFNDFGSSLRIVLPPVNINRFQIQIKYKTNPNSRALYWLTPEQTADKTYPFLLSNNKLIYARSWFPCQDTPSVKFTYTARIWVQKHFRVLMSAILQRVCEQPEQDVYHFYQKIPVPSYAVVIAVGSLPRSISYKERVYMHAERNCSHFDRFPLNRIDKMLKIAKVLCGPYLWERYNICVLPPSIAHFEIECPCLTFISRTIFGADRSHFSKYIARNIAQSWAGNSVTCLSWAHLWLNKSFSKFISRKIICNIWRIDSTSDFLRENGLRNLNKMLRNPINHGFIRCLVSDMENQSPHTATKYVPYEWGCKLLDYLQYMLGGPSVFEPFLRLYFDRFARQSINTQNWIDYLYEIFPDHMEVLYSRRSELYSWFRAIPSISNVPNRSLLEDGCLELANRWIQWNCDAYPDIPDSLSRPPSNLTERNFYDVQKIIFLKSLYSSHTRLTIKKLRYLSHFFLGKEIRNAEIRYLWLLLCIKVRWDDKIRPALTFAFENCSPNYACPIFQHVCEWEEKRDRAIKKYNDNRKKMLAQTWESLQEILHRILHPIPRQN